MLRLAMPRRAPACLPALLGCLAALLSSGCGLFPREEKVLAPPLLVAPEVTYDTLEVERGTIERSVRVSATFTPYNLTSLSFRSRSGRLRRLLVASGDEVKEGQLVAELDTGGLESRIAQQRLQVRKAELIAERGVALGRDRYERELASIDVEIARLELADLQRELEESKLYAPIAGTVIYLIRASEGDIVQAWQTVAQIADPRRLQLVARDERASEFRVGMTVSVTWRDRTYSGEVVQAPGQVPADVAEDMKNAVVVRMAPLPPGARGGDMATLSVAFERRRGVVVIPRDLVRTYLGRTYVLVLEGGTKKERTIEVGLQTTTEVEVVKGLVPGEHLIAP